jgi:electron transfer flavoprotein alpha subunit
VIGRALVLVERRDGELPLGQLGVVAHAAALATDVDVLLLGAADDDTLALLGAQGTTTVHVASDGPVLDALASPRAELLDALIGGLAPEVVLLESSSLNADIAAALAVRRDAGVNWDLVGLDVDELGVLTGTRLALEDSLAVTVGWTSPLAIAVFRAGSCDPREQEGDATPEVRDLDTSGLCQSAVRVLRRVDVDGVSSGLDTAEIIVSGGRGVGSAENFALLEALAAELGGVVGVSMPVVDKGWYPYSRQVGQTGRTVLPRLYLACGISGAIQHRVGMGKSGTIVAINTDPRAPLFGICDFGVVGDLTEVVPRLTTALRERL